MVGPRGPTRYPHYPFSLSPVLSLAGGAGVGSGRSKRRRLPLLKVLQTPRHGALDVGSAAQGGQSLQPRRPGTRTSPMPHAHSADAGLTVPTN
jgi:hypothetical protein